MASTEERGWLEVPPCEKIVQTFEAPVEDPRRLLEQVVGEAWVFASEEALREDEDDEARGERSRGIGEAGELVRQDEEAGG